MIELPDKEYMPPSDALNMGVKEYDTSANRVYLNGKIFFADRVADVSWVILTRLVFSEAVIKAQTVNSVFKSIVD